MANPLLTDFFQQSQRALSQEDGRLLQHAMRLLLKQQQGAPQISVQPQQLRQLVNRSIPPGAFRSILSDYALSISQAHCGEPLEAFRTVTNAMSTWLEFQKEQRDGNWWLPGLNQTCLWLRRTAYAADAAPQSSSSSSSGVHHSSAGFGRGGGPGAGGETAGEKYPHSLESIEILTRFYRSMNQARPDEIRTSRKLGMLFVVVHLFKLYFRINNLSLCRSHMSSVSSPVFPPMSEFPVSQKVTYRYYAGRLHLFDEDYEDALECFSYAFRHCHKDYRRNKRRILQYLVPIKMWFGQPPARELLQKYDLEDEYWPLIQSIRDGNLKAFDVALRRHDVYFIHIGVYLLLEKLRESCVLQLIRRVHSITAEAGGPGNQIPIPALLAGTRFSAQDPSVDVDELECWLANLVFQGRIRGYIAHNRAVVVSKKEPFPSLVRR